MSKDGKLIISNEFSIENIRFENKDSPKTNEVLTTSIEETKENPIDQGDTDIEEQNLNDDGNVEQSDEERPTARWEKCDRWESFSTNVF